MEVTQVRDRFIKQFPEAGSPFLCRVPGRINLIGEHLDYNGLPVLPMAIDREIHLAFAGSASSEIVLRNLDPRYPALQFNNGAHIEPSATGSWDNYCKAAVAGINQRFDVQQFPGMDVLVHGDLPPAAGLSSSSALVVAFALAYLASLGYTLGKDLSRLELAGVLANAEHFVGTAGGGMDQTVILNGEAGHATKINFIPFQCEHIPVPDGVTFVVCDSMVETKKTGNTLAKYNAGPAVCSLITNMVNVHLARTFGEDFSIDCLGDLWFGPLCFNRGEVQLLLREVLAKPRMTPSEIIRYMGMNPGLVREYWLDSIPDEAGGIPLQARARHIFTEYYRVEEGRDALLASDVEAFGELMNASHRSCASDYALSTPELDRLVDILTAAGCYGARLTGAGFGGAVIGLAPTDRTGQVLEAVKNKYYDSYLGYTGQLPAFAVEPGPGARYL